MIALVTNVLLNLFRIPAYAGVGAAIAPLISYAVGHVFANALNKRTKKIFIIQIKSVFKLFSNLFAPNKLI